MDQFTCQVDLRGEHHVHRSAFSEGGREEGVGYCTVWTCNEWNLLLGPKVTFPFTWAENTPVTAGNEPRIGSSKRDVVIRASAQVNDWLLPFLPALCVRRACSRDLENN